MEYRGPEGAEEHPTPYLPLLGVKLKFGSTYLQPSPSPRSTIPLFFPIHSIHLLHFLSLSELTLLAPLVASLRGRREIYTSSRIVGDPSARYATPERVVRISRTFRETNGAPRAPRDCVC